MNRKIFLFAAVLMSCALAHAQTDFSIQKREYTPVAENTSANGYRMEGDSYEKIYGELFSLPKCVDGDCSAQADQLGKMLVSFEPYRRPKPLRVAAVKRLTVMCNADMVNSEGLAYCKDDLKRAALGDEDDEVRVYAVIGLGVVNDPAYIPVLKELASRFDTEAVVYKGYAKAPYNVRRASVLSLAAMSSPQATTALISVLDKMLYRRVDMDRGKFADPYNSKCTDADGKIIGDLVAALAARYTTYGDKTAWTKLVSLHQSAIYKNGTTIRGIIDMQTYKLDKTARVMARIVLAELRVAIKEQYLQEIAADNEIPLYVRQRAAYASYNLGYQVPMPQISLQERADAASNVFMINLAIWAGCTVFAEAGLGRIVQGIIVLQSLNRLAKMKTLDEMTIIKELGTVAITIGAKGMVQEVWSGYSNVQMFVVAPYSAAVNLK